MLLANLIEDVFEVDAGKHKFNKLKHITLGEKAVRRGFLLLALFFFTLT